jgi:hypothetical protein
MFFWPCIIVYQYNENKVMHFLFNLLRIKSLCSATATVTQPTDIIPTQYTKCRLFSASWGWASNARNMQRPLILNKLNEKWITLVSLYWLRKLIMNHLYSWSVYIKLIGSQSAAGLISDRHILNKCGACLLISFFSLYLQKLKVSFERAYNQLQVCRIHWLVQTSHNIYTYIWCIRLFACELCNPSATQYISNVQVASNYAIIEIRIRKMECDVWLLHYELAYYLPDTAISYQYFSLCSTTLKIRREIRLGLHFG